MLLTRVGGKGMAQFGAHTMVAQSFCYTDRSSLAGIGMLLLQFREGESAKSFGLTGQEKYFIKIDDNIELRQEVEMLVETDDSTKKTFKAIVCIDTPVKVKYYKNGGILQTVLREMLGS